jgi:hypothetical protein
MGVFIVGIIKDKNIEKEASTDCIWGGESKGKSRH